MKRNFGAITAFYCFVLVLKCVTIMLWHFSYPSNIALRRSILQCDGSPQEISSSATPLKFKGPKQCILQLQMDYSNTKLLASFTMAPIPCGFHNYNSLSAIQFGNWFMCWITISQSSLLQVIAHSLNERRNMHKFQIMKKCFIQPFKDWRKNPLLAL